MLRALIFVLVTLLSAGVRASMFCPIRACAQRETELESWDCVADRLFAPADSSARFVEQQCHGLGWGNSISSLSVTVNIAAILDARVIFQPEREFDRLWTFNHYKVDSSYTFELLDHEHAKVLEWVENINKSESFLKTFDRKVLRPNTCGKDSELPTVFKCISEALPIYGQCLHELAKSDQNYFALDTIPSLPAFYSVFRKPTALMVGYLKELRSRLGLPTLQPGAEPNPGAWGLFTPGYYMLAFHFRNVPLGFEPLSVMLNEGGVLDGKMKELENFWERAREYARKAREIADCRNETLLIYFATDDVENLRPRAESELGGFGRVVFGLKEEEVGHTSPNWSPKTEKEVEDRKEEVLRDRDQHARCAAAADGGGAGAAEERCRAAADAHRVPVAGSERTEEAQARHHDMALVEWWVLANAQWLATTRHSSFSNSAAWWGLGPGGRMERFELQGYPVPRVDWGRRDRACAFTGAVDPRQAELCPNKI